MPSPGSAYPLQVLASDGRTDLYARAYVYDAAGVRTETVVLPHIENGLYGSPYPFSSAGVFSIVYRLFLDSGATEPADYDPEAETVEVDVPLEDQILDAILNEHLVKNTVGEAVAIIRGLVQHNFRLDQTVYNPKGLLVSGRIQIFRSKADLRTGTDPIATYPVVSVPKSTPNDALADVYKVEREDE